VQRLQELVIHARAVMPQGDLDLRLYFLGSADQAAAAAATVMDRVDAGDVGAASDLRFLYLKILGEMAWGRHGDAVGFEDWSGQSVLENYANSLHARRRATPESERTWAVQAPAVPCVPDHVFGEEALIAGGWQSAPTDG